MEAVRQQAQEILEFHLPSVQAQQQLILQSPSPPKMGRLPSIRCATTKVIGISQSFPRSLSEQVSRATVGTKLSVPRRT